MMEKCDNRKSWSYYVSSSAVQCLILKRTENMIHYSRDSITQRRRLTRVSDKVQLHCVDVDDYDENITLALVASVGRDDCDWWR